jgi:tRNA dimethylallyltransferase
MSHARIILIGGPTASGKSAFAMELARREHGTIINADAMQVYAGLPTLTAQPHEADRAEIPHLLYEFLDPGEASSAGKWLRQTHIAIRTIRETGRTPILVGGTGLYFDALQGGLAEIPDIPGTVRDDADDLYAMWGEEKFRTRLGALDPESAARIKRNDRQRLIRAYIVATYTGKSLGEWQREGKASSRHTSDLGEATFVHHLVLPPRDTLYAACDARFLKMIEQGAVDEVNKLVARGLSASLPAMKILGVREISAYCRGEISLEEAVLQAQQMTRNYAKRQVTWFRNRWKDYK